MAPEHTDAIYAEIRALRNEVASLRVDIDTLVLCIDRWKKATGYDTPEEYAAHCGGC
jgi:hypothetical protein